MKFKKCKKEVLSHNIINKNRFSNVLKQNLIKKIKAFIRIKNHSQINNLKCKIWIINKLMKVFSIIKIII